MLPKQSENILRSWDRRDGLEEGIGTAGLGFPWDVALLSLVK